VQFFSLKSSLSPLSQPLRVLKITTNTVGDGASNVTPQATLFHTTFSLTAREKTRWPRDMPQNSHFGTALIAANKSLSLIFPMR
jgi:hypothetical protein